MEFATQYNHQRSAPEKNDGKTDVDRAGYISAQKRIENIMFAGMRLVQSRREMYDFLGDELDTSFDDPTRSKNWDLADAFQMDLAVKERIAKAKRDELVQREASKASQTAQETQEVASGSISSISSING